MGRPTILDDTLLQKAQTYIHCYKQLGDVIPSVAGLACFIGVTRETIYDWSRKGGSFSDIHREIMQTQERELTAGALRGTYNPAITKLLLTKHGYSDKVDQTNRNVDMTHEQWLDSLEEGD